MPMRFCGRFAFRFHWSVIIMKYHHPRTYIELNMADWFDRSSGTALRIFLREHLLEKNK